MGHNARNDEIHDNIAAGRTDGVGGDRKGPGSGATRPSQPRAEGDTSGVAQSFK